jgi:hypothetical protein
LPGQPRRSALRRSALHWHSARRHLPSRSPEKHRMDPIRKRAASGAPVNRASGRSVAQGPHDLPPHGPEQPPALDPPPGPVAGPAAKKARVTEKRQARSSGRCDSRPVDRDSTTMRRHVHHGPSPLRRSRAITTY